MAAALTGVRLARNDMVSSLKLQDFRSFAKKNLKFSPGVTVIVGDNASGKTNILEALHLCASGKSFRARREEEMIRYEADIGRVILKTPETELSIVLTRGQITQGNISKTASRKRFLVNGVGKRMRDFVGNFRAVIFTPQDMELVTTSPGQRRRFLDNVLMQVDYQYRSSLSTYEKGLRSRNKLLWAIREKGAPRTQLAFWDKLLIKHGEYIGKRRQDFIYYVNSRESIGRNALEIFYDRSTITEKRLGQYARAELASAATLVGPHRDDFNFRINGRDGAYYASRGEQRVGVLWLKLSELDFVEQETPGRPTLLLDDIFSELDHEHRALIGRLSTRQQTVMTTADPHFLEGIEAQEVVEL